MPWIILLDLLVSVASAAFFASAVLDLADVADAVDAADAAGAAVVADAAVEDPGFSIVNELCPCMGCCRDFSLYE